MEQDLGILAVFLLRRLSIYRADICNILRNRWRFRLEKGARSGLRLSHQMDKRSLFGRSPVKFYLALNQARFRCTFSYESHLQWRVSLRNLFHVAGKGNGTRFRKSVSIAVEAKLHIRFTYPVKIGQVIIHRFPGNVSCISCTLYFQLGRFSSFKWKLPPPNLSSQSNANKYKSRVQYHLHYHLFQNDKANGNQ